MTLNVTPFLLILPALLALVTLRLRHHSWQRSRALLGWRFGRGRDYGWGLLLALVLGGGTALVILLVAPDLLRHPAANTTEFGYAQMQRQVTTIALALVNEAFFTALGEEVFFRGVLGGWLMRHWGFWWGNTAQAVLFLLPHLLLLAVSRTYWPILLVQGLAGWALGWLRYHADSILPGWLAHTLVNTLSDVLAMH